MSDREEFIETQATFQFGLCDARPELDLRELARVAAKPKGSLLLYNPEDGSFVPPDRALPLAQTDGFWNIVEPPGKALVGGARLSVQRQADALNELAQAGLECPVIIDMHDALHRENTFPVFQYNRLTSAKNAILWPLERVHGIGSRTFCAPVNPAETPFREKKKGLSWRGAVRGFTSLGGKPVNIRAIVQSYQSGQMSRELVLAHLETLPRYQFVSGFFDQPNFDIGFNNRAQDRKGWSELPEISRYQKPHSDPAEQAEYKYLFSIQGTDVASSFGWQLGTQSVILREMYPWEVFFDCHFRPWEHYVPILPDFSDLLEKIDWCESHEQECVDMIKRRHTLVPLLLDEAARQEALRRVVERYDAFYASGKYRPHPVAN